MRNYFYILIASIGVIAFSFCSTNANAQFTPGSSGTWILSTSTDLIGVGGFGSSAPVHKLDVDGDVNIASGYAFKYTGIDFIKLNGTDNVLLGLNSGNATMSGNYNVFTGNKTGNNMTTGSNNSFFGYYAGYNNTAGSNNSFFGYQTGLSLTNESDNSFFGYNANGYPGISNSTAIGANSYVSQSNSIVLGGGTINVNVGINNSAPSYTLDVAGDIRSTTLAGGGPVHADATGKLFLGSMPITSWELTGNAGTTAGTDFIGTTDNKDLVFKTNNTEWLRLYSGGELNIVRNTSILESLGIGTTWSGAYRLVVAGNSGFGGDITVAEDAYINKNLSVTQYATIGSLASSSTNAVYADNTGKLILGSSGTPSWGLTGNSGTNPTANFIGTTDNTDLVFRTGTGSNEDMRLMEQDPVTTNHVGYLGIGTQTPISKLDVNGDINIALNKVIKISGIPTINAKGTYNIFVGADAGKNNTTGVDNSFLGYSAGIANTGGSDNTFGGMAAGISNTDGSRNLFLGTMAGEDNTTGSRNIFIGYGTGDANVIGNKNTCLGYKTKCLSNGGTPPDIYRATAIGTDTRVTASHNIILGSIVANGGPEDPDYTIPDHVGIGVTQTDPQVKLHVLANDYSYSAIFMGGKVGIKNATPTYDLDVTDDIHASRDIIAGRNIIAGLGVSGAAGGFGALNVSGNIQVGGHIFTTGSGTSDIGVTGVSGPYTGCFGDGYAMAWNNKSDRRLKKDINEINYGLKELMKIRPVTYYYNFGKSKDRKRIGLIAQEVKEILPEVVVGTETDTSYLSITYSDIIPVLIQSIKEQQKTIEVLQEQINILSFKNSQKSTIPNSTPGKNNESSLKNNSNSLGEDVSVLFQNQPNPFKDNTTIEYYLTLNTQKASLIIFDMNGTLLKTIPINQYGKGAVQIMGGDLKPGMYFYSLIADNKEVDSKKMILLD